MPTVNLVPVEKKEILSSDFFAEDRKGNKVIIENKDLFSWFHPHGNHYKGGNNAVAYVKAKEGKLTRGQEKLIKREGYVDKVYYDNLGVPTYGVGQTGSNIARTFKDTYKIYRTAAEKQAEQMPKVTDNFVDALTSMNFQLGTSWAIKFPSAWKHMQEGKYRDAALEIEFAKNKKGAKTLWYNQTEERAIDMIKALNTLGNKVRSKEGK